MQERKICVRCLREGHLSKDCTRPRAESFFSRYRGFMITRFCPARDGKVFLVSSHGTGFDTFATEDECKKFIDEFLEPVPDPQFNA